MKKSQNTLPPIYNKYIFQDCTFNHVETMVIGDSPWNTPPKNSSPESPAKPQTLPLRNPRLQKIINCFKIILLIIPRAKLLQWVIQIWQWVKNF